METKIKTMVVDDHPLFRKTLKDYLSSIDIVDVIGEADNGIDAVKLAKKIMPELIIMDVEMPEMDGIQAFKMIKDLNNNIRIILYSGYDTSVYEKKEVDLSVIYLNKSDLYNGLPEIIKSITGRTKT